MRLVLDTNVLVSGILLPESVPGRLFELAELDGSLLFSEGTFSELRTVLLRPKFGRYLDASRRDGFLVRCRNAAADLLALDPFEGIPIVTPADYLAKVGR